MRLVLPLHILASIPLWALAPLFYFLTIGVIWSLRDYQEGLGYNVARSSQLGDAALVGVILMAVSMLQDGRSVPLGLNAWPAQLCMLAVAAVIGWLWITFDPTPRWGDRYHHLFVAPLLVYLGLNAGLIILYAGKGWEITVALLLFFFWVVLVGWDIQAGRMDQRIYLWQQRITGLKN